MIQFAILDLRFVIVIDGVACPEAPDAWRSSGKAFR